MELQENSKLANKLLKKLVLLGFIISYLFSIILLRVVSTTNPGDTFFLDGYTIRGVVTQIQLLLSLYVVLKIGKTGYLVAVFLNFLNGMAAFIHIIQSENSDAIPGIITNISTLILITLVIRHNREISQYIIHIKDQRQRLIKSERKLYEQAYTDTLTGLYNRSFIIEKLTCLIEDAQIDKNKIGVFFFDLDSFKTINDTLGHSSGDELLLEVSKRLESLSNNWVYIARFGGDEFLLVYDQIVDQNQVEEMIVSIREKLRQPIKVKNENFNLTASIGVAIYPGSGTTAEELIGHADTAMYEAKNQGKNYSLIYDTQMSEVVKRRTNLINHLEHAIERDEFHLVYQPQIDTYSQKIVGIEALLRWNNGEYGWISPGEFIPLAEKIDIIKELGLWVLEAACREYQKYPIFEQQGVKLALNFSTMQIVDTTVIQKTLEVIEKNQLNPELIVIEVTESVGLNHPKVAEENLNYLKNKGVKIAIDDFGKEYSSLKRLRYLPIDMLKIDMAFIQGIGKNNRDEEIIKWMIYLGESLGIDILAEGVEEKEQYNFLAENNCSFIQGYYFYRPMKIEEVLLQLSTSKSHYKFAN